MRTLLRVVALALVAAFAGCASVPADPSKMSAEQLKEWVRDKNANMACTVVNSPYGRGVMTYVVLDKAVIVDGSLTMDNECRISITNSRPVPVAAPASAVRP